MSSPPITRSDAASLLERVLQKDFAASDKTPADTADQCEAMLQDEFKSCAADKTASPEEQARCLLKGIRKGRECFAKLQAKYFFDAYYRCLAEEAARLAEEQVKDGSPDSPHPTDGRPLLDENGLLIENPTVSQEELLAAVPIMERLEKFGAPLLHEYITDKITLDEAIAGILNKYEDYLARQQYLADEIVETGGGDPRPFDANGDGNVSLSEAIATALTRWQKFKPLLEEIGVTHPLDISKIPPEAVERIRKLAAATEKKINIPREAEGFCEVFVPAFVEAGAEEFDKGGLCFRTSAPRTRKLGEEPEMTAAESFAVCIDPKERYGSCSENTYRLMSAMMVAGIPCEMKAMVSENHLYPALAVKKSGPAELRAADVLGFDPFGEFFEQSIDPSRMARHGWSQEINPVAVYLLSRGNKESDPILKEAAFIVEPELRDIRGGERLGDSFKLLRAIKGDSETEAWPIIQKMLDDMDISIRSGRDSNHKMRYIARSLARLSPNVADELVTEMIKRWPECPYLISPLVSLMQRNLNERPAKKGVERSKHDIQTAYERAALLAFAAAPDSGWNEVLLAQGALVNNDVDVAMNHALLAIRQNPQNAQAHHIIANCHMRRLDFDNAEASLKRAIRFAPDLPGNHLVLAQICQYRGDIGQAQFEAEREAFASWPNPAASFLAMDLARMRWQPKELARLLKMYGDTTRDNVMLSSYRAWMSEMAGEFGKANVILQDAARKRPDDLSIRFSLINNAFGQWDTDRASEELSRLKLDRSQPVRIMCEFNIAIQKKEIGLAEDLFKELSHAKGVDKGMLENGRAALDLAKGRYEEAIRGFSALAAKNKYDFVARGNLVYAEIVGSDVNIAEERYRELVRDFPDVFFVRGLGASLILRKGRYADALAAADNVLRSSPKDFGALSTRGMALVMLGRTNKAYEIGRQMDKMIPKSPTGMLVMARALKAMGKTEKAKALIPKIKAIETHDNKAWPLFSSSALARELDEGNSKNPR